MIKGVVSENKIKSVLSGGFLWSKYLAIQSTLLYSGRTGLVLNEKNGNDATIFPPVFRGNGSTHYNFVSNNHLSGDEWIMYMDVILSSDSPQTGFWLYGSSYMRTEGSQWRIILADGVNVRTILISYTTLPLESRKYTFKIVHTLTDTKVYESDNLVSTTEGTFSTMPNAGSSFCSRGNFDIMGNTACMLRILIYGDLEETIIRGHYIFTGEEELYNLADREKYHGDVVNYVSDCQDFNILGSQYLLDNGLPEWHPTQIVPFLIGFNESESAETALEIFDRSNTTRQTDYSRASDYYESTNLATKCRYHSYELFPNSILSLLFEDDYKNVVFSKTIMDEGIYDIRFAAFQSQQTEEQTNWILNYFQDTAFDNGKMLIQYDGSYLGITTYLHPVMVAEGLKATYYVRVDQIGEPGFPTWDNLKGMIPGGCELQCHSVDHLREDELTQEELIAQFEGVNAAFIANELEAPVHHAYPYGYYDEDVLNWIPPYRLTGRGADVTFDNYEVQWKNLQKYEIKAYTQGITDESMAVLKANMDEAKLKKSIIIMYRHNGIPEENGEGITVADFTEIVQYGKAIGLDFITMSELYDLLV